jgi:hypothetical protein
MAAFYNIKTVVSRQKNENIKKKCIDITKTI